MSRDNQGLDVQNRMMKWFRGNVHPIPAVDFATKTTFYEVKSCNLFNKCHNANSKRKFRTKPHKNIISHQFGRFQIRSDNHFDLKNLADKYNKLAKYIFVVVIGRQLAWKVWTWDAVDVVLRRKKSDYIRVEEIFGNGT